ncbi:hypothetical protein [Yersinia rohdei]|uniref:hypothetical protein n=1 Tax=Yersinia rohdei TaxID=29485 RepID=UPI0036F1A3CA
MRHSHRYTARITATKEKAHQYCVNQCLMGFFWLTKYQTHTYSSSAFIALANARHIASSP